MLKVQDSCLHLHKPFSIGQSHLDPEFFPVLARLLDVESKLALVALPLSLAKVEETEKSYGFLQAFGCW